MGNGFFDALCLYWPAKAQRGKTQSAREPLTFTIPFTVIQIKESRSVSTDNHQGANKFNPVVQSLPLGKERGGCGSGATPTRLLSFILPDEVEVELC